MRPYGLDYGRRCYCLTVQAPCYAELLLTLHPQGLCTALVVSHFASASWATAVSTPCDLGARSDTATVPTVFSALKLS